MNIRVFVYMLICDTCGFFKGIAFKKILQILNIEEVNTTIKSAPNESSGSPHLSFMMFSRWWSLSHLPLKYKIQGSIDLIFICKWEDALIFYNWNLRMIWSSKVILQLNTNGRGLFLRWSFLVLLKCNYVFLIFWMKYILHAIQCTDIVS